MGKTAGHLTDRQRRFAEAYIELGNAEEAAHLAGFSRAYAPTARRQPAVQAYLEELRSRQPAPHAEVMNFLVGVMRGNIKASDLRTEAAYNVGKRAGLWKTHKQCEAMIKEAETNE
jgi:phage terminase small subunit